MVPRTAAAVVRAVFVVDDEDEEEDIVALKKVGFPLAMRLVCWKEQTLTLVERTSYYR